MHPIQPAPRSKPHELHAIQPTTAQRSGQAAQCNLRKYRVSRSRDGLISQACVVDPKDPTFLKDLRKPIKAI